MWTPREYSQNPKILPYTVEFIIKHNTYILYNYKIKAAVPQGSALGPLFQLYCHDKAILATYFKPKLASRELQNHKYRAMTNTIKTYPLMSRIAACYFYAEQKDIYSCDTQWFIYPVPSPTKQIKYIAIHPNQGHLKLKTAQIKFIKVYS